VFIEIGLETRVFTANCPAGYGIRYLVFGLAGYPAKTLPVFGACPVDFIMF
jgi:hypothetical protein